jgi:hypothetical protein
MDGQGIGIKFLARARDSLPHSIPTHLGPSQPCIHQVLGTPPEIKLTAAIHLMPRLRLVELYLHSPIHLYGMVHNEGPFLQCLMDQYSESA